MSHTDQLNELIRLWNCLNDGQRVVILALLRFMVEEGGEDDDEAGIQDEKNGD